MSSAQPEPLSRRGYRVERKEDGAGEGKADVRERRKSTPHSARQILPQKGSRVAHLLVLWDEIV